MVTTRAMGLPARPVAEGTLDGQAIEALLDGERMRAILRRHLPWLSDGRFVIRNCSIDDVRYNSRAKDRARQRPFLCVSYRLDVTDTLSQRHAVEILYAEVYPEPLSGSRFKELIGSSPHSPRTGKAIVHLPELGAIVRAFPNDPRLPHLPEVMDPDSVKHHLPYDRLPAGLDGPADVGEIRVEVLRYKPETHCAARYEVGWGREADRRVLTLFGKTFSGDRAGDIHRQIDAVWRKSMDEPKSFLIGSPLGYARSVRTVWQASHVGLPLLDIVKGGDCGDILRDVGTALAILHETEPASAFRVGIGDQLAEMQAQIAALIEAFPHVERTLEPIATRLREEASTLVPVAETLVHGDFIAKNLLTHEGRIVVCDFDDFVVGDPVQDLARFLLDLLFLEDRDSHVVNLRERDSDQVNAMAKVVTEAYRSRASWNVSEEQLKWHWRVQAIAKIHYYYKRQHLRPGFERDLGEMLALLG